MISSPSLHSGKEGSTGKVEGRRSFAEDAAMTGPYTVHPEWLGDPTFTRQHGSRFAYVVGEMARGIATPHMVVEAVRAGLVGFYGSAGLRPETIAAGLDEIEAGLGKGASAWGANLIHSPQQPGYERAVVDLFLERGVTRVSASAFSLASCARAAASFASVSSAAAPGAQASPSVSRTSKRATRGRTVPYEIRSSNGGCSSK